MMCCPFRVYLAEVIFMYPDHVTDVKVFYFYYYFIIIVQIICIWTHTKDERARKEYMNKMNNIFLYVT